MSLPLLLDAAVCALMLVRAAALASLSLCAELMQSLSVESDFLGMFTGWISLSSRSLSPALARGFNFVRRRRRRREDGMRERRILTAQKLDLRPLLQVQLPQESVRTDGSLAYQEMWWNVKSLVKRFKFGTSLLILFIKLAVKM
jgi:hypothetical protein